MARSTVYSRTQRNRDLARIKFLYLLFSIWVYGPSLCFFVFSFSSSFSLGATLTSLKFLLYFVAPRKRRKRKEKRMCVLARAADEIRSQSDTARVYTHSQRLSASLFLISWITKNKEIRINWSRILKKEERKSLSFPFPLPFTWGKREVRWA